MTVETTDRKQTYAGGQASLAFSFKVLDEEDVKLLKTLISTGAETSMTYDVDYTVSLNSDGVGGTVTVSPTISTLYTLTVYRETTNKQESDYDDYNQFPADTLESDLDRRTLVSQEGGEETDRTLKLPISVSGVSASLPVPVADNYLGWNTDADAIENKTPATLDFITVDTDTTLAANSDTRVASQKAIKTYVDGGIIDYSSTSTITGWSSYVSKYIYVKKIGKTVFCVFFITGTSNSAITNFTLPYATPNMAAGITQGTIMSTSEDDGSAVVGRVQIGNNTNIVYCFKDTALTPANWTASGTKTCIGELFYETP